MRVLGLGIVLAVAGCSSTGGSAIRTGGYQMPAYSGAVQIYAVAQPPTGAVDLGVVEVHATQREASVETLLPLFIKKVADIGGNIAVIDGVRARFDLADRTQVETFYYSCGLGGTCAGTRAYALSDEILLVSMFGHALTTQLPDIGEPLMPKTQPLSPDNPPIVDENGNILPPVDIPPRPSTPPPPPPANIPPPPVHPPPSSGPGEMP